MSFDFARVKHGDLTIQDLAESASHDDLRAVLHEVMGAIRVYIVPATDQHVTFDPHDPKAYDPFAVEGEETISWSLAHLVAHVTASSEEGAAFSSLLARGIAIGGRLRYETPWRSITTQVHCLQRIEESRRMCLAYLDTWPDNPQLDVFRQITPEQEAASGKINAPAAFLFGLYHQWQHLDQFEWTLRDAQQAHPEA